MKPTRKNYEIWCIDYLDGKLSSDQMADFMLFLGENPDIALEFDELRDFNSEKHASDVHMDFSFLKKDFEDEHLNSRTFEEFCIAYHENDLSDTNKERLQVYLNQNPPEEILFRAYEKLKFTPDQFLKCPEKNKLKKSEVVHNKPIKILLPIVAAAACIVLLINVYQKDTPGNMPLVAYETYSENIDHNTNDKGKVENNNKVAVSTNPGTAETLSATSDQEIDSHATVNTKNIFDTTTDRPDVFIPAIDFKTNDIIIANNLVSSIVPIPVHTLHFIDERRVNRFLSQAEITSFQVKNTLQNPSLDNILRKSVEGINQIAETDLQYHSDTDENGRLIAFALSAEKFNIKRKVRNN